MTLPAYDDLYRALKDLNKKPPYGFKIRAYRTRRGEPRAYVELTKGVLNDLDFITERVEAIIPPYTICLIRDDRIYVNLNSLKYRIRHDEGSSLDEH